jgi:polysaccharide biosynthesis/export protein
MRRGWPGRTFYGISMSLVVLLAMFLPVAPTRGASVTDYTLGAGDVLEISVWGYPELSRLVPIGPDGKVALPLIGTIVATGVSVGELTDLVTKAYGEYIIDPRVLVTVKEFRKLHAALLGQVARPGAYDLPQGARLLDLLAAAGGLTDVAAVKGAQLLRPGQPPATIDLTLLLAGDAKANKPVVDGLTLVIPEDVSSFVTVQGEVAHPGRYRLKGDVRVIDALVMAGGLTEKASVSQATLVREGTQQQSLDLDALLLRRDMNRNIPLKPGDVVLIPEEINNKIYVIGDVKNAGSYQLKGPVTLLQALAMAGGPEQRGPGTAKEALIVRRPGGSPAEIQAGLGKVDTLPNGGAVITADLRTLMNDPSKDVPVQAGDVLVLPQTKIGGLQIIASILAGFTSILYPFHF